MGYNDSFSKANSIEALIEKLNKSLESGNFEKTEIPLIYQIKGKIMPGVYCFYEEAKDYIIGASVDCLVICKDQALCTYDEVERIFEDDAVYKPVEKLPLFKHLQSLDKNKTKLKAFNKTMELLKKHGVDADTFDLRGEYWTSEKSHRDDGIAYSFENHQELVYQKAGTDRCFARFMWRPDAEIISTY